MAKPRVDNKDPMVGGPIGYCIYDPSHGRDELSTEHVMPTGLGSGFILLEASCEECRRKTHYFETECLGKNWGLFRDINKKVITGKKAKRRYVEITSIENGVRTKKQVLLNESPSFVTMPVFSDYPGLSRFYYGPPQFEIKYFHDKSRWDLAHAMHAPTGSIEIKTGPFDPNIAFQQLAKIAHGLMYLYFEMEGVKALLTDIIVHNKIDDVGQLIGKGQDLGSDVRATKENGLHLIQPIVTSTGQGPRLLGFDICLFAELGCPTYRIHAGEIKTEPKAKVWPHRRHSAGRR